MWIFSIFRRKKLPLEGSYIEHPIRYQYSTRVWKGIVGHHSDGKHYYITGSTGTIYCLKP